MNKLKVVIAGCGRISAAHADALHRLADRVQVVLAVDIEKEKAKTFAQGFNCAWSNDPEAVFTADADAVHLCLPHDLHSVMAIRAMRAGLHVLTEKPIALTLQQADEMIRVQQQTGRKLAVVFQTRFVPGVEILRKMIGQGRFGKILSARSQLTWNRPYAYYESSAWKGTWSHEGGGVLIDQAIHSIDRVRYILNDAAAWIDGSIHNRCHHRPTADGRLLRVEDVAEAVVGFRNGCLYSLYACDYYRADAPITIEFLGEKGRCGLIQEMGFYELDGCYTEIRSSCAGQSIGPDYWGSSHYTQILDFYDAIQKDRPVAVDGLEARKTLEIVKGIYLSSLKGQRVYLPFEDVAYQDLGVPV